MSSPWHNPRDTLKCHVGQRVRRQLKTGAPKSAGLSGFPRSESQPAFPIFSSFSQSTTDDEVAVGSKRTKNPFRSSPRQQSAKKFPKIDAAASADENSPSSLLNKLAAASVDTVEEQNANLPALDTSHSGGQTDFRCLLGLPPLETGSAKASEPAADKPAFCTSPSPPIELRPSTKLKIVSDRPLLLSTNRLVKPADLAKAVGCASRTALDADCTFHTDAEPSSAAAAHDVSLSVISKNWMGWEHLEIQATQQSLASSPDNQLFAEVLACGVYFQYPDLPWMKTFPRIDNRSGIVSLKDSEQFGPSIATLGEHIKQALLHDWHSALECLYYQLKCGDNAYFYVCCPLFTVMFSNWAQARGAEHLRATITPTSSALRQQLSKDGIEFELIDRRNRMSTATSVSATIDVESNPNSSSRRLSSTGEPPLDVFDVSCSNDSSDSSTFAPPASTESQPPCLPSDKLNKADAGRSDSEDSDEDAVDWIDRIGVSPSVTNKLRRICSHNDRRSSGGGGNVRDSPSAAGATGADAMRKTAVLVTGSSVHALFNTLLETRLCHAVTGQQAGMPPTLLSARPFSHATLQLHTTTSRSGGGARASLRFGQQQSTRQGPEHVLELAGVLLPSNVDRLLNILAHVNPGRPFKAVLHGTHLYAGLEAAVPDATGNVSSRPRLSTESTTAAGSDELPISQSRFARQVHAADRHFLTKHTTVEFDGAAFRWAT